jgi:hypothetical protein
MIRGLESRISRKPRCCYVVNCSDPPTADELSEISRAKAEGRRVAMLPRVCATVLYRRGSRRVMRGAAILFITSEDVVRGIAATRSYVSRFRLGALSAKACFVASSTAATRRPPTNCRKSRERKRRAAALQCCLGFVRRSKNGLQSTDLRLTNMRSLESRIVEGAGFGHDLSHPTDAPKN